VMWLTTPVGIVPVTRVNGQATNSGKAGEITQRLSEAWESTLNPAWNIFSQYVRYTCGLERFANDWRSGTGYHFKAKWSRQTDSAERQRVATSGAGAKDWGWFGRAIRVHQDQASVALVDPPEDPLNFASVGKARVYIGNRTAFWRIKRSIDELFQQSFWTISTSSMCLEHSSRTFATFGLAQWPAIHTPGELPFKTDSNGATAGIGYCAESSAINGGISEKSTKPLRSRSASIW